MKKPFRIHHILQLLEAYDPGRHPLDLHIRNYFRSHKALGSKDRAEIAETVYGLVRWKGLLDHAIEDKPTWEKRLALFQDADIRAMSRNEEIPAHIRVSFPISLYQLIAASHGKEKGNKICLACNEPAPTTVRVNTLKATREEMLEKWKDSFDVSPCRLSSDGIVFHRKINFFSLPEFKAGLFEVQDEGSQLLARLVQAEPGQQVLDYCSGSGGKTLAFAPQMKGTGQIFLHDIRKSILAEAKKRLKRAGVQNAQIIGHDDPKMKKLKKRMDWVLVDAPCSGTGTLRRNPDMKWKFTEEMVDRLVSEQRVIFEKGLSYLKPGGRIVYATCSILKEENHEQLQHFMTTYDLKLDEEPFQSIPQSGKMDGFFAAVLRRS